MRRWTWLWVGILWGCGAAGAHSVAASRTLAAAPNPQPVAPTPEPVPVPEPAVPTSTAQIRGLTGTLNKDDVHQTMESRQTELDACIAEVRRRESFVHGSIRFAFAVDAAGHVAELRPLESDIGHFALEHCLTTVVAQTAFPPPDGRATARFEWGLEVLGAYEASEPLDPALITRVVAKRSTKTFSDCDLRRAKGRMDVTLYVGRKGRVLCVGAVPKKPIDDDKLTCVLDAIKHWPMPHPKRRAKVSFVLR